MNERLVFVILLGVISVSLDIGGGKPEKRRF